MHRASPAACPVRPRRDEPGARPGRLRRRRARVSRLVGRSRSARLSALVLYCASPFVFNRLYADHLPLLLGYALALCRGLSLAGAGAPSRGAEVALWWAVLSALSPHYAWIYGAVVLVSFAVGRPWGSCRAGCSLRALAAFVVTSLYVLLPHSAAKPLAAVGSTSLDLYRTTGDPHYGLFVNVADLWLGPRPRLPKALIVGWPLLLLAVLVVAGVGAGTALRRPRPGPGHSATKGAQRRGDDGAGQDSAARHPQALVLVLIGTTGYFLAPGSQGADGAVSAKRATVAAGVAGVALLLPYYPTIFLGPGQPGLPEHYPRLLPKGRLADRQRARQDPLPHADLGDIVGRPGLLPREGAP